MSARGTRSCVFCGPSLGAQAAPRGVHVFPPATRGALAAAVTDGYTRIGFIDGAVDGASRLPLRELRAALAMPHIELFGGASMGALRAAQLESAGMRGIGRVYRLFRRGSLSEADEVYVLHASAALRYRCLTLPLVNIRYTLRSMRRSGHLDAAQEQAIVDHMRAIPWFDRDRHSLGAAVYAACRRSQCGSVMHAFDASYDDIKRKDALLVLSMLLDKPVHSKRGSPRYSRGTPLVRRQRA